MIRRALRLSLLLAALLLTACGGAPAQPTPTLFVLPTPSPQAIATDGPAEEAAPEGGPSTADEAQPGGVIGPESYPADVNPLTGEQIDPARLQNRPLLVKVSNESPAVRPLSGLSYADHVWMYQMEGLTQTRYTAVYLGQSPEAVGSVRSVRLIDYEVLIPMYDAILAYSGSSGGMTYVMQNGDYWQRVFREEPERGHLVRLPDVPRPGTDFYHRLFAVPDEAWAYADERAVNAPTGVTGLAFSAAVPAGGAPTAQATFDYPRKGPIQRWQYDAARQAWLSFTTDENANAEEAPDIDRLNDEQLAFENIVFLYAGHYFANFVEDPASGALSVGINLTGEGEGWLLRDGQRYPITWQRAADAPNGQFLRLLGENGQVIALRPGQTWFNVSVQPGQPDPFDDDVVEVTFE